ncbi:hypothetical protein BCF59_0072 [Mycoplasmopsis mustelae]|uniref:Uncharacterized protein n=1 Tax=Mycoplasmopsis mustelae TaxID=171289 RepID=A0A4R7UER0_9BACT|nr:hypothetical protein [Mycoplasmopsis mustelae]TDV24125.1 hypothetical protein BCF59_0072 [Mycoplasmopsis mustelae]
MDDNLKLDNSLISNIKNQIINKNKELKIDDSKFKLKRDYWYKISNIEDRSKSKDIFDAWSDADPNFRVSNEVPNSWWFRAKNTMEKIGYVEDDGVGLCEYIALSMMIEYMETFVTSGFITNKEYKQYFNVPKSGESGNEAILKHKYFMYNQPKDSFVWKLYKDSGMWKNVKSASWINEILMTFLKNKEIKNHIISEWSASWIHSSNPEDFLLKNNLPVMLAFANFNIGHNVVIYGYDKRTNKF